MAGEVRWNETQVTAEIEKLKRKILGEIGRAITKDAKELCPVGIEIKTTKTGKIWKERFPGTLRASIHYRIVKKGSSVQVIAGSRRATGKFSARGVRSRLTTYGGKAYMGMDPFYARFVEFGTSKMLARPYLRPALLKNQGRILRAFTNRMR